MKRDGLRHFRQRQNLSQEKLGALCGVTKNTVFRIESGKADGKLAFWNALQREFELTGDQIIALQNGKEI